MLRRRQGTKEDVAKPAAAKVKTKDMPINDDKQVEDEAENVNSDNNEVKLETRKRNFLSTCMIWWESPSAGTWPFNMLALDLRSLALWRIVLGILMAIDLSWRWNEVDVFMADSGMCSRLTVLSNQYAHDGTVRLGHFWFSQTPISLYMMTGAIPAIKALMCIHFVVIVSFTLGYRTQLSSVLAWFFHMSIQSRCPQLQNKGEELTQKLLLWAILLPIGRVWSLDAWIMRNHKIHSSPEKMQRDTCMHRSLATVGVFFQCWGLYFTTGMLKDHHDWVEGYAAHASLMLDTFRRDTYYANFLRSRPDICYLANYAAVWGEKFGIFGIFGPAWLQLLTIWLLEMMQLSFHLTLTVFLFPLASTCAALPLLPSLVWDKILPKSIVAISPYMHALAENVLKIIDHQRYLRLAPSPENPNKVWMLLTGSFRATLSAMLLGTMLYYQLESVKLFDVNAVPRSVRLYVTRFGMYSGMWQKWDMFAPGVKTDDAFLYFPGVLRDGTSVDAWPIIQRSRFKTQDSILEASVWDYSSAYRKQPIGQYRFENSHWIMYLGSIHRSAPNVMTESGNIEATTICNNEQYGNRCENIGKHVCKDWNEKFSDNPAKQLIAFKVVVANQMTTKGNCLGCAAETGIHPKILWIHPCIAGLTMPRFDPHPPRKGELHQIGPDVHLIPRNGFFAMRGLPSKNVTESIQTSPI